MCHVIGFIVEIRKGTSDIKIDTNPKNVGPFEQRKKNIQAGYIWKLS